jgi:hypothetical protein
MKKKIGTMLDEELIFKAKQAALSERQALSHFLTDALKMYLQSLEKKKDVVQNEICATTRGAMKLSITTLVAILEEEKVYEAP